MMNVLFAVFLSILGACSSVSTETPNAKAKQKLPTLKEQLDLVASLCKSCTSGEHSCNNTLLAGVIGTKELPNKEELRKQLHEALHKLKDLRTVLLNNASQASSTQGVNTGNGISEIIHNTLPSIYLKLDKLRAAIEGWEGMTSYIDGTKIHKDITIGQALASFEKNGFSKNDLNTVTLANLKARLDEIIGQEKPLHKVLSAYGRYYMLQKPANLGGMLSWMLMYAACITKDQKMATEATTYVNTRLTGKGEAFVQDIKNSIQDDDPVYDVAGPTSEDKLYPLASEHLRLWSFVHLGVNDYWPILTEVCNDVEDEVKELEQKLNASNSANDNTALKNYLLLKGLHLQGDSLDTSDIAEKLGKIAGKDKPLTKICKVVKEIKKLNSVDDHSENTGELATEGTEGQNNNENASNFSMLSALGLVISGVIVMA